MFGQGSFAGKKWSEWWYYFKAVGYLRDLLKCYIYMYIYKKMFCFTLILSTPVFSLTVIIRKNVQFLQVSVFVDNSGNITTDLYVKPTDSHQYLLATSCHPNHTKRSIPYSHALRILRICSSIETAKLRCTELVDMLG